MDPPIDHLPYHTIKSVSGQQIFLPNEHMPLVYYYFYWFGLSGEEKKKDPLIYDFGLYRHCIRL